MTKFRNQSNVKTINSCKKTDEKVWFQPLTEDIAPQEIINLKLNKVTQSSDIPKKSY